MSNCPKCDDIEARIKADLKAKLEKEAKEKDKQG
jgi:hypothetical protein